MHPAPGHELTAALGRFLTEIYRLQDVGSLHAAICRGLGDLVPGDNVFVGHHDMERTLVTGCTTSRAFETPDFFTIVNSCAGEHPLWEPIRTGGQVVRCISDHASRRVWENTRLYQEALGPEGVRDHISIEFGDRSKSITSVGMFRSLRGFHASERAMMDFLIPQIDQALANAIAAERAGLVGPGADLSRGAGMVRLDPDGLPREWNPRAETILAAIRGSGRESAAFFPAEMDAWARRTRVMLETGLPETAPESFGMGHHSGHLTARLYRDRAGDGYVMTLRLETHGPLASLTRREREVLRWVREGKRNEEIATILGIGITTVKSHLKQIFAKLGAENRTSAARMAEEAAPQH